jgi:SAM-dependent methyltransferase
MAAGGDVAGPRRAYRGGMIETTTTHTATAPSRGTAWTRVMARIYDPFLWLGERRAMSARRRRLLEDARGVTLEIGSGTGLNLSSYPTRLERLVLAEPDPAMRERLERRVAGLESPASVIDAPAESLPFADGTVDTVVSTLVLCTVEQPQLALREIARVLAPGGRLLFIEHIRSSSRVRSFWQDRLAAPWRAFASGCHCNRETIALMAACGFELDVSESAWRGMPGIVRPLAYGHAEYVDGVAGSVRAA